jgi:hypothetical protein
MKKEQIEELDNIFRKKIRARDTYPNCPICHNPFSDFRKPEVCHFQKRRFLSTRWVMHNAILGCSICNTEDVDISLIIDQRFGEGISDFLIKLAHRNSKTYYDDVIREICPN